MLDSVPLLLAKAAAVVLVDAADSEHWDCVSDFGGASIDELFCTPEPLKFNALVHSTFKFCDLNCLEFSRA